MRDNWYIEGARSRVPVSKLTAILASALLVAAAGTVTAASSPGAVSATTLGNADSPTAPGTDSYLSERPGPGHFPLVSDHGAAPLAVSENDYPGVVRVVDDLKDDIEAVTGVDPQIIVDEIPAEDHVVLIGTIGKSPLIDELVSSGALDVSDIEGKWETWVTEVLDSPLPGVEQALVIAGSDQRGTIFGSYDLSKEIGISPWHFWSDVPPPEKDELFVIPGRHSQGEPAVKYRGFFINDEWPNLAHWAVQYFGPGHVPEYPNGFNADFYEKVFETMLRLKANYLWPAVWGRAFAEDDPENHARATEYGVVMGTSHEAPMMR
jgi:hypothetical protein